MRFASFRTLLIPVLFLLASTTPLLAQTTIHVPADQPSIQRAIDASSNGDTVLVAPGTYNENIDFHGRNITVQSSGGAAGTILDGGRAASAVQFVSGEARTAQIVGFTIRNGDPVSGAIGGGVYVHNASPTILDNVVTGNYCSGIASQQGAPLIRGNTISATHAGATACVSPGTPINLYLSSTATASTVVDTNVITGNLEITSGAIQALQLHEVLLQNNILRNNTASASAQTAGINLSSNTFATVVGNEITNNTNASIAGGAQAIYVTQDLLPDGDQTAFGAPMLRILNNTVVGTAAASAVQNPAIFLSNTSARNLVANNIVTGPGLSFNCSAGFGANAVFQNNLAASYGADCNADTAHGNAVAADPQLTLSSSGDYTPGTASPAIDAGNNSVLPQTATDVLGNARAQSAGSTANIDLGAVERTATTSAPQSRLAIAPARFEVLAGQAIDVTAALVNTGPTDTNPAAVTLFLDGTAVQTMNVVSAGTAMFTGIPITAGLHELYATSTATATIPAARSVTARVNGVTDPNTSPGLDTDPSEHVTIEVDPLLNVGSLISAQVRCRLASGSVIHGDMRILDNGVAIVDSQNAGTTLVNATYFLSPGPHIYECDYSNTGISSSTLGAQIVAPVPPSTGISYELYSLPDPTEYGDPVIIGGSTGTLPAGVTGTLRITEGATVILNQALAATGTANITTTTLTPGVHTFLGVFTITGSTLTAGSSGSFTQTVHFAPTQITLSASPITGVATVTPITLTFVTTSSYAGTPITGTVTLLLNGKAIGIAGVVNGSVVLPAGTLPQGVSVITAVYNGSAIFAGSTSNSVTITMGPPPPPPPPPDFNITPATPSLTVMTEHHADVSITLNALNGFNGTVRISCGNLPAIATCTFNASQYALSSTAPVTFTVETSAVPYYKSQLDHAAPQPNDLRAVLACALPLPLLLLLRTRRSRARSLALLFVTAAMALTLTACSGKYPDHTPPGTYNVVLNATGISGSTTVTHAFPFTLTVTPE